MEREEITKLIEMYNLGYSFQIIGDAIGASKKTINRRVNELKEQGILKERPMPTGHTRLKKSSSNHDKHINNLEMVRVLYEADTPLKDICVITGFKYHSIIRMVSELCRDGMKRRERKRENVFVPQKKRNTAYVIGEPHKCDYKTCVYGNGQKRYKEDGFNACNFCLITGKCRSTICKSSACTVYEKITKSNPRRKGEGEP